MMKNLLYKELRLALHPTTPIFLLLSAMLLIPNYPYYVIFFYTTLGLFFITINGRENHDLLYSMLLPIPKREIVRTRILLAVLIELAQVLLAIPFALLRYRINPEQNAAGSEANLAFFGVALLLLGLFNLVFFPRYYRDTNRVGIPFLQGVVVFAAGMGLAETASFLPVGRDWFNTFDPAFLPEKLGILAAGAAAFALLTWLAACSSVRAFETLDL